MNNRENGSLAKACHGAKRSDKRRLRRLIRLCEGRKSGTADSTDNSARACARSSGFGRKSDQVYSRTKMLLKPSNSTSGPHQVDFALRHANNFFDHRVTAKLSSIAVIGEGEDRCAVCVDQLAARTTIVGQHVFCDDDLSVIRRSAN